MLPETIPRPVSPLHGPIRSILRDLHIAAEAMLTLRASKTLTRWEREEAATTSLGAMKLLLAATSLLLGARAAGAAQRRRTAIFQARLAQLHIGEALHAAPQAKRIKRLVAGRGAA